MNIKNYWVMLTIAVAGLCIGSCSGDDELGNESSITVNDPDGTIIANLQNTFHAAGNGYWDDGIEMNGVNNSCLGLNPANNLQAAGWYTGQIVSIGKVKGLSSVTKIPESGWAGQAAALPGYGYVYRNSTYNSNWYYARIYVIDYIVDTTGGIIGVTIKYQPLWNPDNE